MYPPQMTNLIAQALFPSKCAQQSVPAMPCRPATSEPQPHREIEQHLKHVSPLAGFEDLALLQLSQIPPLIGWLQNFLTMNN